MRPKARSRISSRPHSRLRHDRNTFASHGLMAEAVLNRSKRLLKEEKKREQGFTG